jgi:hypothetical protein
MAQWDLVVLLASSPAVEATMWLGKGGSGVVLLLPVLALTSSCASEHRPGPPNPIGQAIIQPLHDISLLQDTAPAILSGARQAPYGVRGIDSCDAIGAEIDRLDEVLGPDLDQTSDESRSSITTDATASAIHGVIGLPFRGAIRTLSGAAERDSKVAEAVLAGMVRRGFLKGIAMSKACGALPEAEE